MFCMAVCGQIVIFLDCPEIGGRKFLRNVGVISQKSLMFKIVCLKCLVISPYVTTVSDEQSAFIFKFNVKTGIGSIILHRNVGIYR
jgi:hypothetical protein